MTGSVRNIAHAIADGIEDSGMEAKIRTVPEFPQIMRPVKKISLMKERCIVLWTNLLLAQDLRLAAQQDLDLLLPPLNTF